MKNRRALYLGNTHSFYSLDAFLNGFSLSAEDYQYQSKKFNDFSYFNIWLLGHLPKHYGESGGWYWQISNRNIDNDENAFKEFFGFLEIFKTSEKKIEEIQNVSFTIKDNTQENHIEKKIDTIQKITFENSTSVWIKAYSQKKLSYQDWYTSEEDFLTGINNLKDRIITKKHP